MIVLNCFILLYLTFTSNCADLARKFTLEYNPNCTLAECFNEDASVNLIYIKATGPDDIEHILYSTIGSFTVMIFRTSLDGELSIDWSNLLSKDENMIKDSLKFSGKLVDSCAYMIPTIYEFNDASGTADMTKIDQNLKNWNVRMTNNMKWVFKNASDDETNIGTLEGFDQDSSQNGSFKFSLRYFGKKMRDKYLPHALLSSETSSIDFIIDSINATFKDSKFGMTLLLQSGYGEVKLTNRRSLDDEYTPGTFQQWTLEVYNDTRIQNYLQWKPIFYYTEKRSLESSTLTKHYTLKNEENASLSIASAFFYSNEPITALNISFGIEGNEKDGFFYPKYNYSVWTFTVGLGEPENEKMSSIVSLVIFIGFGLPAAIIVIGLLVLLVKKLRGSPSAYQSL